MSKTAWHSGPPPLSVSEVPALWRQRNNLQTPCQGLPHAKTREIP